MGLHPVRTAWVGLVAGLALHVGDEASTGFLDVYNPTIRAVREQLGWFPMPEFRFDRALRATDAWVLVLATAHRGGSALHHRVQASHRGRHAQRRGRRAEEAGVHERGSSS
jgi:hypothetical protein